MENNHEASSAKYVCIKALENGVNVIGMTRGRETKLLHTEKVDAGEVCILQFTDDTSAIKIRGKAEIYTEFGIIESE